VTGSRPSDLIVIGAGIVGSAIACELARRGASVRVVDHRRVGMGATQASAGVLAPYIEADDENPTFLDLTVRSLGLYETFVKQAVADSGLPVAYRRTGTIEIASTGERMAALRRVAASLESRQVPVALLDGPAACAAEPNLGGDVAGALLIPSHGFVGATGLTQALIAAAQRYGAELLECTQAAAIRRRDGRLLVETDRGSLMSDAVVLAAGSWSGQIDVDGLPDVPVRPVRGQLMRLAWSGAPLRRVVWAERCYMVPWDDGTLLVGATVEEAGFDERTTVAAVRDLLDAACEVIPKAWTCGFLGARVGFRPAATDLMPIIGRSRTIPNLMYATGHYRNGVLLAPLTARLVADAMLDGQVDPVLDEIGPQRFGL
jgi:glycine oxidase